MTGTIVERDAGTLLVDEGTEQGRKILVIPDQASGRIQVRFPRLQPGYLVDVIGLRHPGFLEGLIPATSQPPYRADHPPSPPLISGQIPDTISGTATWHEPGEEPEDLIGLAYPALDPETGCEGHSLPPATDDLGLAAEAGRGHIGRHTRAVTGPRRGTASLTPGTRRRPAATGSAPRRTTPTSSRSTRTWRARAASGCRTCPSAACCGSATTARQRARELPVTSCGASARLFCDRCVTCGTSPRGRVADLTMSAFVDLGGDLDRGCFNATITIGG